MFNTKVKIEINNEWISKEDNEGFLRKKISCLDEIIEVENYFFFKFRDFYIIIPKPEEINFKGLVFEICLNNNIIYKKVD